MKYLKICLMLHMQSILLCLYSFLIKFIMVLNIYICKYVVQTLYKHDDLDIHCICVIRQILRYFIKMYGFFKIWYTDLYGIVIKILVATLGKRNHNRPPTFLFDNSCPEVLTPGYEFRLHLLGEALTLSFNIKHLT